MDASRWMPNRYYDRPLSTRKIRERERLHVLYIYISLEQPSDGSTSDSHDPLRFSLFDLPYQLRRITGYVFQRRRRVTGQAIRQRSVLTDVSVPKIIEFQPGL